jgi:tRNA(fMet)-specific endonuclease VapC
VTTKFLLDTNIVSEPLRPKPADSIMRRLNQHEGEMAIAALVWHELHYGCTRMKRSRRRTAIERYIDDVVFASFPILDYDYRAADWHAIECARLIGTGKTPPFVDG